MNKKWVIPAVIVGLIVAYFILINIISSVLSISINSIGQPSTEQVEGYDVRIGVSDSVGVTVKRSRWYGTIVEQSESGGMSRTLYLFGLVGLPLETKGASLVLWHIILLVSLGTLGYFIINRYKKYHFERGYY